MVCPARQGLLLSQHCMEKCKLEHLNTTKSMAATGVSGRQARCRADNYLTAV